MCGIVGAVGRRDVTPLLIEGLKRLSYRGYDSAGVAVFQSDRIYHVRAAGKLDRLESVLTEMDPPLIGRVGIAHTRWATHGAPTWSNAHPHCSESEHVAVVHNGIIENYHPLREQLTAEGFLFSSETDTEVIPHLIERELAVGISDPERAVRRAIEQLHGAFALGVLIRNQATEKELFCARRGSPLLIGLGEEENFIASDAPALGGVTHSLIYLQDDDLAILDKDRVRLFDLHGRSLNRPVHRSFIGSQWTEKWPYRHFMQKEIFEQPTAVGETLKAFINPVEQALRLPETLDLDLSRFSAITVIACGTSRHAGLVGEYWIEQMAHLPVTVEIASEFRYRRPPLAEGGLVIAISQSGETADTLAALRHAGELGQTLLAIVNVPESSIAREADAVLQTQAGPEIGVASTKAFTTQLAILASLAILLAKAHRRLSREKERELVGQLQHLPARLEQTLLHEERIAKLSRELFHADGFLFLGRGTSFPIALEGALKLKEISYIHAEGYAAGEMKHGPIALIDDALPVIVVAPKDALYDKVMANLEEVKARGGRVVLVTEAEAVAENAPHAEAAHAKADFLIPLMASDALTAPILYTVPLQLLAYHIALLKGTDVDQPRNLAKSVTVE